MKILIVAQNFYPEYFKSTELAEHLVNRGHTVEVLTSIPNYPGGVYFSGYGIFKKRVENYKGIKIYRAFQTPRGRKAHPIALSLNYLTFMVSGIFWGLFYFIFKKKYDAIIVFQNSPITQAIPAIIIGKCRRIPIYTWVQDIWPDSVLSTINSSSKFIEVPLSIITNLVYRASHKILMSSPRFKELINRDKDYSSKLIYQPNWSEDLMEQKLVDIEDLPNGFIIMMAGNISDGQDIDKILECIEILKYDTEIKWVFVGGGAKVDYLREEINKRKLQEVAFLLGRKPFEQMHSYYERADVMLLTLQESFCPHLNSTIPSRVQSYMSAGKPIVGMIGIGASEVIHEARAGLMATSGDTKTLSTNILQLKNDPNLRKELGNSGRKYYLKHFTSDHCIECFEQIISNLNSFDEFK